VKPRPDVIEELLLRAVPHCIFLRMVSVLKTLELPFDIFGGFRTFEDMIVQYVYSLRCVGESFDRRRKVTAGSIFTGAMNAGDPWEATPMGPPLTESIALREGARCHLLHDEERVLSRQISITRLDERLNRLFVDVLLMRSYGAMVDGSC
jgi:hypothetical protein